LVDPLPRELESPHAITTAEIGRTGGTFTRSDITRPTAGDCGRRKCRDRAELECGSAAKEHTQPTRSLYKQMSGANNVSGERLKVGASSVVSDAGKLA
jgi:hypothetical protein